MFNPFRKSNRHRRGSVIGTAILGGFMVLTAIPTLFLNDGLPAIGTQAFADEPAARNRDTEYVFTASQDGRKIYMWQRVGSKPPTFIGESDAILSP